jgi:hypothetical protein
MKKRADSVAYVIFFLHVAVFSNQNNVACLYFFWIMLRSRDQESKCGADGGRGLHPK